MLLHESATLDLVYFKLYVCDDGCHLTIIVFCFNDIKQAAEDGSVKYLATDLMHLWTYQSRGNTPICIDGDFNGQ